MSLIAGDQKDEIGWEQAMPWIRSLTRRRIAQIWMHHAGHDTTHGYGTKTREWQMDNVLHFEKIERNGTDVSFKLTLTKAREREPATRDDFRDVKVTLTNEAWTWEAQSGVGPMPITAPATLKFYEALCMATAASGRRLYDRPAATIEEWQAQCVAMGLIDTQAKPASARALMSRHRLTLVSANWVAYGLDGGDEPLCGANMRTPTVSPGPGETLKQSLRGLFQMFHFLVLKLFQSVSGLFHRCFRTVSDVSLPGFKTVSGLFQTPL